MIPRFLLFVWLGFFALTPDGMAQNELSLQMVPMLTVKGIEGSTYQIQYANAAGDTNQWQTLTNVIINGGFASLVDTTLPVGNKRFYKSVLYNPPVPPPTITKQPQSQTVNAGANVTFSITAVDTRPLSYQWRRDGADIPGKTNNTLIITAVKMTDGATYSVVVSNGKSAVQSESALLRVNAAPVITEQPKGQTNVVGQTISMFVSASGNPSPEYQWRKYGVNLAGQTNSTITLNNIQTADAGDYTVVVKNAVGTVVSLAARIVVNVPPTITLQPKSQTLLVNATAIFTVTATGTAPLSYQWMKDGVNISGATSSSLILYRIQESNAGSYKVVVSNMAGTVASAEAFLAINVPATPPAITRQPQAQKVNEGSTITFNVSASGTSPMSFQWKKNGVSIPGATASALTLYNIQIADAGNYTVTVSNSAGSTTSVAAVLTVSQTSWAPDSIAGKTFTTSITSGTGPFATRGSFKMIFAASGNTYLSVPISGDGMADSGTYTYSKTSSTTATLITTLNGVMVTTRVILNNSTEGTYVSTVPGYSQSGNFTIN